MSCGALGLIECSLAACGERDFCVFTPRLLMLLPLASGNRECRVEAQVCLHEEGGQNSICTRFDLKSASWRKQKKKGLGESTDTSSSSRSSSSKQQQCLHLRNQASASACKGETLAREAEATKKTKEEKRRGERQPQERGGGAQTSRRVHTRPPHVHPLAQPLNVSGDQQQQRQQQQQQRQQQPQQQQQQGGDGTAAERPVRLSLCMLKMASVRLCQSRLWGFLLLSFFLEVACTAAAAAASDFGACSSGAGDGGRVCAAAGEPAAAAAAAAAAESSRLQALEAYTALLEEKLQQQERQQREQQKGSVFIIVALLACIGIVLLVAIVACKVYVHSLQAQLRLPEEQQEDICGAACATSACSSAATAASAAARRRQQPLLHQGREQQRQRSSSNCSSSRSRNAFLEALDGESSEGDETLLWPRKEDIEQAEALGEARAAAANPSEEVQQKQQQLETRCAALFERLNAITDATNAFRSSNSSSGSESEAPAAAAGEAAAAAGEGAAAAADGSNQQRQRRQRRRKGKEADPARVAEQQALLTQLQQLFREIETSFSSNKPAQVSAMIRCCNVLLRADGLAILKACADCEPLHAAAQSIIETVVPCIWAT
ncbi:hypothetical protein Esti_005948 [Eimeria stiedai]